MNIAEALHSTREKEGGCDRWDYTIKVPLAPRSCSELCFFKVLYGQAPSLWSLLADGFAYRDVQRIQGHAEVIQRCEPCLRWILDRCPLQCKEQPRINDGAEPITQTSC